EPEQGRPVRVDPSQLLSRRGRARRRDLLPGQPGDRSAGGERGRSGERDAGRPRDGRRSRGAPGSPADALGPRAEPVPRAEPTAREPDPGRAQPGARAQGPRRQAGAVPRPDGRGDARRARRARVHQQPGRGEEAPGSALPRPARRIADRGDHPLQGAGRRAAGDPGRERAGRRDSPCRGARPAGARKAGPMNRTAVKVILAAVALVLVGGIAWLVATRGTRGGLGGVIEQLTGAPAGTEKVMVLLYFAGPGGY